MPRQARRAGAGGRAAIIAAVSAVLLSSGLAGAVPARAAVSAHSPRPARVAAPVAARGGARGAAGRDIRHARQLRHIPDPGGAKRPAPPGRPAGKPRRPAPWTLAVPSIGLTARVITLGGLPGPGALDSLSLPVPPLARAATEAGWYPFTAVPGAAGNAVIAGHVDTYRGPAVFYDLYRLRRGDPVYLTEDGTRQRFGVSWVRELPKPRFPVNEVFGSTRRHMLWLITCGGAFDYKTRHYLDNIVVSATWVPPAVKHPGKPEKPGAKYIQDHQRTAR